VTRNNDPILLVLASLAGGDKHGYAMIVDIQQFAGITLGPGTLYGAITRLDQAGWIAPVKSDDRRQPYTLTLAGRQELQKEVGELDGVVRTAMNRLKSA